MNKIKIILCLLLLSASFLFAEDYLVVIHSDLYDYGIRCHLNYLLENQRGHNLVYRQISNGLDSQDIRNIIVNKNNNYNNLQYVLLIGQGRDNSIPPGKKFPAANHTANSNNGNYLPFFYYNNNIHWEKRRDLPSDWKYVEGTDLLIGRVPAKNKTQIHLWLNKLEDYYQKVGQANSYNEKIRFFCEDNKNTDNHCLGFFPRGGVNGVIDEYLAGKSYYNPITHFMSDIHSPNNSAYSSAAEDLFINKIENGAALTCVNGTAGSKEHMAGFVWDKNHNSSDWDFSCAEPTFIFGNTCSIGNTSNPNANNGTVLQDLLFDAQSGIAGFFGPTVYTTQYSCLASNKLFFKIIINDEERVSGEIARSFFEEYPQLEMNIPYINFPKPFSPEFTPYHVKSMVLYGDPAMPLALNTSSLNKKVAQKQNEVVSNVPAEFALKSNYPNPFNPTTQIAYDLPQDCQVTITIYDIQGRKIRTLIDSEQSAGYKNISWNSRDQHGKQVPTGVYIYKMQTSTGFNKNNKMMFIK